MSSQATVYIFILLGLLSLASAQNLTSVFRNCVIISARASPTSFKIYRQDVALQKYGNTAYHAIAVFELSRDLLVCQVQ